MDRTVLQKRKRLNGSHHCSSLQAFVWGLGTYGQLGLGGGRFLIDPVKEPVKIQDVKVDDDTSGGMLQEVVEWNQIACGGWHSAAVTSKGDLFTWGNGSLGQLGHGNTVTFNQPKLVTGSFIGKEVIHVSCGLWHTAVVTGEGELYTCGMGHDGQLGHGNLNSLAIFSKVEVLEGHAISQVACGTKHTIVLTSEGVVYAFGNSNHGRTGHGVTEGDQSTPKKVIGCLESKKVVFVASGRCHSACITDNGDTYTWGKGSHGRLGHGDEIIRAIPKLVDGLVGKKAKEVSCGLAHTIVRTENGRLYSFGTGAEGQLGHCNFDEKLTPTLIQTLEGKFVVQMTCGVEHSMALTSEGRLYTWGKGADGRLGHGSELNYCIASIVERLIGFKVLRIAAHHGHSVALVENSNRSYAKMMKAMVNDEKCSDVVFYLKNNERVHANRGLLIGRSEYFRAMFRSGMRESKENEVKVQDCSKTVFLLFLEYLYKGEVDIGAGDAVELYVLSDRYQENDLSRQCLEVIKGGLTPSNAIEFLAQADGLGLAALKDVCMEYVLSNYGMIENEGLESLSPSLTVEMLRDIKERYF